MGSESFYQNVRFADPDLLRIFDLDFIAGDSTSLDDPTGIIVSESTAIKYFGTPDAAGKVITFNSKFDFRIAGVFRDVPLNSHFNSLPILSAPFEIVLPMKAGEPILDWKPEGNFDNLSLGNMTYVLLPAELDGDWLQAQLDGIFERHVDKDHRQIVEGFYAAPLSRANLALWDTMGLPVITAVQLLSFLVLVVACVNYTNLATAQALGRSREVGMRKTMGASQGQLLVQFLVESLVIAAIAMVVALAAVEVLVPLLNNLANKALRIEYFRVLPWLALTTVCVGLCAGIYPAWLITRASPIDALRDIARRGRKGAITRSVMIGAQFAISAFMLAIVAIVYMQNRKVEESSYIFPRSEIYTISRLNEDDVNERLDTLKHELETVPGVKGVTYSWQVPYEQNNSTGMATARQGDEAGSFQVQLMQGMEPGFFEVYDIPLLAGRDLSRDVANDRYVDEESESINIVVNQMMLDAMGIESPADAINQRLYDLDEDDKLREMVIVGVVPTQNIVGLFAPEKPWIFRYDPDALRVASIRIEGDMARTVADIEKAWDRVMPEYPIQGRFLDEVFDEIFNIMRAMNAALAAFAFIALTLALIGLFGLAAFMATQRTREIGVRKVLGASSAQIARLLVWQFSKPVAWALGVALPAAYFGSKIYLDFFADRIGTQIPVLLVAGVVAVLLAWATVAGHAIRIARSNPVRALRYE
jgi:putative ABC transport system permease protein